MTPLSSNINHTSLMTLINALSSLCRCFFQMFSDCNNLCFNNMMTMINEVNEYYKFIHNLFQNQNDHTVTETWNAIRHLTAITNEVSELF